MHQPPSPTDPDALRRLIPQALPGLAVTSLIAHTRGCDSHVLEVNGRHILKVPRTGAAAARLRKEAGILELIGNRITLPVPHMRLVHTDAGPVSVHEKLPGATIETPDYQRLAIDRRDRMAGKLARFYAELHDIPPAETLTSGAGPIEGFRPVEEIAATALPQVEPHLRAFAEAALDRYPEALAAADDEVFGLFDGHGWNMAFDHERGELNGIYDFADSGIGRRHLDLQPANWIDPDLTLRIADRYEALTAIAVDRSRLMLYTTVLRLNEMADGTLDPELTRTNLRQWHQYMTTGIFRPAGHFA